MANHGGHVPLYGETLKVAGKNGAEAAEVCSSLKS